MELSTFIIWSIIIIFAIVILVFWLFQQSNFKQKITYKDRLFWSLVISGFAVFIFGIIMKPYITYNYCSTFGINDSPFHISIISCKDAIWWILLLLYLIVNIFLHLLLINMYEF